MPRRARRFFLAWPGRTFARTPPVEYMRPIIDARNPALWRDKHPDAIWRDYRVAMEGAIRRVFDGGRARPIVAVREAGPRRGPADGA